MKRTFYSLLLAVVLAVPARAWDLRDVVDGLGSGSGAMETITGLVNDLTSTSDFNIDDIVGTWSYSRPAVTFKGGNALANVGGSAASTMIENKLEPYYKKLKLNNQELSVAKDHTFTMKMSGMRASGTISKGSDGTLNFKITVGGRSLGTVNAMASKSGNTLKLTFDASKLMEILNKVSEFSGNSTLKSIQSLLKNYDGIYIGSEKKRK